MESAAQQTTTLVHIKPYAKNYLLFNIFILLFISVIETWILLMSVKMFMYNIAIDLFSVAYRALSIRLAVFRYAKADSTLKLRP